MLFPSQECCLFCCRITLIIVNNAFRGEFATSILEPYKQAQQRLGLILKIDSVLAIKLANKFGKETPR